MTILSFFWFIVAIAGAFIVGYMCGKHDAHKLAFGDGGPEGHGGDHDH